MNAQGPLEGVPTTPGHAQKKHLALAQSDVARIEVCDGPEAIRAKKPRIAAQKAVVLERRLLRSRQQVELGLNLGGIWRGQWLNSHGRP